MIRFALNSFFRHEPTAFERIVLSAGGLLAAEPGRVRLGSRSIRSRSAVWMNTPRRVVRVVCSSAIPWGDSRPVLHTSQLHPGSNHDVFLFLSPKRMPVFSLDCSPKSACAP